MILQGENLTVSRGGRRVVCGFNLQVGSREIVGLSGPSGCGKSSLLLAIFGLIPIELGHITFNVGQFDFTWPRIKTNAPEIVFRRSNQLLLQNSVASLNPHRILLEEFHRVAKLHHPKKNLRERQLLIDEASDRAELPRHTLDLYPFQISGGEAQRATLARALLVGPRFIACDEIWASLDLLTSLKIVQLLRSLRSEGLTLLVVSHQIEVLQRLCDRIVGLPFCDSVLDI